MTRTADIMAGAETYALGMFASERFSIHRLAKLGSPGPVSVLEMDYVVECTDSLDSTSGRW